MRGKKACRHRFQMPRLAKPERLEDRRALIVGQFTVAPPTGRGTGYDGVVGLDLDGDGTRTFLSTECTGTLLSDRRHVLTAAHCVDDDHNKIADADLQVQFDTAPSARGSYINHTVKISDIAIHPDWNGITEGSDIAILTLPQMAPAGADAYEIQREFNEVGKIYTVVGFGNTGSGLYGQASPLVGVNSVRRFGKNVIDAASDFNSSASFPPGGGALVADFDSGRDIHDAFGVNYQMPELGLGIEEVSIAPGDSGGPLFLGNGTERRIAGVNSYLRFGTEADEVPGGQASFGEFNVFARVSKFADYIDGVMNTKFDAIIDMHQQPAGIADFVADDVSVTERQGVLNISVNGVVVLNQNSSQIASVEIIGTNVAEGLLLDLQSRVTANKIKWRLAGGQNTVTDISEYSFSWTNPGDPMDVNGDNRVTVLDVAALVDALNDGRAGSLPEKTDDAPPYLDPNADGRLTILDVAMLVDFLESRPLTPTPPSESSPASTTSANMNRLVETLAQSSAARLYRPSSEALSGAAFLAAMEGEIAKQPKRTLRT